MHQRTLLTAPGLSLRLFNPTNDTTSRSSPDDCFILDIVEKDDDIVNFVVALLLLVDIVDVVRSSLCISEFTTLHEDVLIDLHVDEGIFLEMREDIIIQSVSEYTKDLDSKVLFVSLFFVVAFVASDFFAFVVVHKFFYETKKVSWSISRLATNETCVDVINTLSKQVTSHTTTHLTNLKRTTK